MAKISDKDAHKAFGKLNDALDHQFRIKLVASEVSEDSKTITVLDSFPGTPVQYPGSLRGKWLLKNAPRYGFELKPKGVLEFTGEPEPELVAETEPQPSVSLQQPEEDASQSRRHRRQEAEDGTNKES